MDGMASIVFSDLDLSSEFDAAQLLFYGTRCPKHVRVRVCATVPCYTHKMSAKLQREIPQYYVSTLKDVAGPLSTDGDSVPRLEITFHMRAMYHCHVKGLLLIQYPAQLMETGTVERNRVRRMAASAPPSLAPPTQATPTDPNLCHKEAWTTTMAEVGISIDNLIAPQEFTVNQCVGVCTLKVKAYSNHAYIRHRYNQQQNSTHVAEPCCVPIEVNSLPLLLVNERGNLVLKHYHDMVVKNCGCI